MVKGKRKKVTKIFGFRLSDTTALLIFFISIGLLFSGTVGLMILITEKMVQYTGFIYVSYIITIIIGIWLLRKSLKYKRIRK